MTDKLMRGAGFGEADAGPFVTELRATMAAKAEAGLQYQSPGTWVGGEFWEIDPETRAQALLAADWAVKRHHTYRVECLDPPIHWQFDTRTMRRRLVVDFASIPAWLGDRWRELGMTYRIWRDRKLVNPYLASSPINPEEEKPANG